MTPGALCVTPRGRLEYPPDQHGHDQERDETADQGPVHTDNIHGRMPGRGHCRASSRMTRVPPVQARPDAERAACPRVSWTRGAERRAALQPDAVSLGMERNLLVRGRERIRDLQPPLLPEHEAHLLRRPEPVRMGRAEGRARPAFRDCAKQVLMEIAVLATRLRPSGASVRHT